MEQEGTNTTLELDLGSSWREMKSFKTTQEQARRHGSTTRRDNAKKPTGSRLDRPGSMRGRVRREEAEEGLSRRAGSTTRREGHPGAISEEGLSRPTWLDVTSRRSPPTLYFVLLTSGSTRSNASGSYTSSSTTSFRAMQFRKLSGCYECHMIVDPSRYPISPRVCACSQCGEVFPKLESLELHQAVRHAVRWIVDQYASGRPDGRGNAKSRTNF
ncbi:Zinc finger C2H2-type [Arabidopsis suecica]|uniref:Zinc finger C2H2-type n=1 Tax=Arabidopsis suecica TaxID=45249 RepID=A0A8T2BIG9_ARASU|nr:Zinc finger C2H2-type [Arabidopsis suecica]